MSKFARYLGVKVAFIALSLVSGCASQSTRYSQAVELQDSAEIVAAIETGDDDLLIDLVRRGRPVNVSTGGPSALELAAAKKMDMAVLAMLKAGADPQLDSFPGQNTALHRYVQRGNLMIVNALLAAGANIDAKRQNGETPLAIALNMDYMRVAKSLIKQGADVNAVYEDRSLLMHAVAHKSIWMIQILKDSGAKVDYANSKGETALSLAKDIGDQQVVLLLEPPQQKVSLNGKILSRSLANK